jgi:radical SAM-linked protein
LERGFVLKTIRIKFIKDSSVRFISHLDMMKAFQRAIRRAGLEAEYSLGFNPQMQMVFGAPLSLGFTSCAEYADFAFAGDYEPAFVMSELNKTLPSGLRVESSGVRTIKTNIMADIRYAEYEFGFESVMTPEDIIEQILSADNLSVEKTRKGRTKTIDIRRLIVQANITANNMRVLVSAGNRDNLNPRLLAEAVAAHVDPGFRGFGYNRLEQYVERAGRMVLPLSKEALENK